MTTEQHDALTIADGLEKIDCELWAGEAAAKLRHLHYENQKLVELSLEEAKINGAGAERELRLMAELDESKRINLRDEAMLRIAYLAIDKMLPSAFCDEGVEALKQLKERLK